MPNNFDEASAATEEMFANEQLSLADAPPVNEEAHDADGEQNTEILPAEETPENETHLLGIEQAAQTAELAAELATEKDGQLKKALADIEALKQQNIELQGTIDEISKHNTENIVNEALAPPTLDINSLAFADEEAQNAAVARFAEEMSAYNRQELMKEMAPAIEFAKKGMRDAETKEVVSALSQIPELANIEEMQPQLDRIIANSKWLSSEDVPTDEKYIAAYAMARGIESINNPDLQPGKSKSLTAEELMAEYNRNPDFRDMVEKQRLQAIKQNQQVPTFSASGGAANAALNIKEKPQTLEEASKRTFEDFASRFN